MIPLYVGGQAVSAGFHAAAAALPGVERITGITSPKSAAITMFSGSLVVAPLFMVYSSGAVSSAVKSGLGLTGLPVSDELAETISAVGYFVSSTFLQLHYGTKIAGQFGVQPRARDMCKLMPITAGVGFVAGGVIGAVGAVIANALSKMQ